MALLNEERDYAEAATELKAGVLREGLWAKCFAESSGNLETAKALYLRYRVELIRDERMQEQRNAAETAKIFRLQTKRAEAERRRAADREASESLERLPFAAKLVIVLIAGGLTFWVFGWVLPAAGRWIKWILQR